MNLGIIDIVKIKSKHFVKITLIANCYPIS